MAITLMRCDQCSTLLQTPGPTQHHGGLKTGTSVKRARRAALPSLPLQSDVVMWRRADGTAEMGSMRSTWSPPPLPTMPSAWDMARSNVRI